MSNDSNYLVQYEAAKSLIILGKPRKQTIFKVHIYFAIMLIHTYVHTYIHTYIHTYVRTYVHTYIHTYVRTYVHTYIHTAGKFGEFCCMIHQTYSYVEPEILLKLKTAL